MHILLADDDKGVLDSTCVFLEACGHTFDAVENGELLLAQLETTTTYHAVVTDHHMPLVTGLEALRKIRAPESRFKTLPVIVLADAESIRDEVTRLNAVYLQKPTPIGQFEAAIDAIQEALE